MADTDSPLPNLLRFLAALGSASLHYDLTSVRADAVMVRVAVPGQRWEVEFLRDGSVEVEKFISDGTMFDQAELTKLLAEFGE
jgi:hypothetical protein